MAKQLLLLSLWDTDEFERRLKMNFQQMIETLSMMDIPYDAEVIIVHDFDGDRQGLEIIEYDPQKHILYLKGNMSW